MVPARSPLSGLHPSPPASRLPGPRARAALLALPIVRALAVSLPFPTSWQSRISLVTSPRPVRHPPFSWIRRPLPGRRWNFNPLDLRAAQHTLCPLLTSAPRPRPLRGCSVRPMPAAAQTSRGKTSCCHRTPAGSTSPNLDGWGLRGHWPDRLPGPASYPVLVHQVAVLGHASFRPRLATTPLRFANPSPPSGWIEDLHLQAADHARHARKRGGGRVTAAPSVSGNRDQAVI